MLLRMTIPRRTKSQTWVARKAIPKDVQDDYARLHGHRWEGITSIATVHDSFGCLPPRAARFLEIIRAELARMYEEHDVLRELLDQARADLDGRNHSRMPSSEP
jgi:hypothetical protein